MAQREREKAYKTISLPGDCNGVMKKEAGPRVHGLLIKLSKLGSEGWQETEEWKEGARDRE